MPRRGHAVTTAKDGRTIKIHPRHELLKAARKLARTDSFDDDYRRWRPMAERSIAWLVRNNRRCPYRGRANATGNGSPHAPPQSVF